MENEGALLRMHFTDLCNEKTENMKLMWSVVIPLWFVNLELIGCCHGTGLCKYISEGAIHRARCYAIEPGKGRNIHLGLSVIECPVKR